MHFEVVCHQKANQSPSADILTCARRKQERILETGVFPSLDCVSGTLCLLHYVTETFHLYSLRDFWRYFCLWGFGT